MKKIVFAALSLVCAFMCALSYASETSDRLSRDIVRLHIIANSDSEEDQALKLRVRDRLLSSTSSELSKEDIPSMLDEYRRIAEEEVRESGYDQSVNVEYGRFDFPTKSYGRLTYPAGEYDAVRITLGDGAGQNWWCVLFPPLCYVRGSVDSEAAAEELKAMLSPEDYELITSGEGGRLPVKVKFKIVEWINSIGR
ncbi:MAG: stage II sporulation protein R [Oscillospiraceae bacterium]|nr:stage II sporulation protein R [Oscillospiraceae bacterium]